jgi:hypothetical protein
VPKDEILKDERKGRRQGLHDEQGQACADAGERVEAGNVADSESDGAA